jgi:hypothetical protein
LKISTTFSPTQDFSLQVLVSFYFNKKVIQSFQENITFLQNNSSVTLKFPINFKKILYIRVKISDLFIKPVFILEEIQSNMSKQDFSLRDKFPSQIFDNFLSTDKKGKFRQTLFLNDYYFNI